MESEAVEPETVASAAEAVTLGGIQQTAGRALRAAPLLEGVKVRPLVCDAADGEEACEEGKGVRR